MADPSTTFQIILSKRGEELAGTIISKLVQLGTVTRQSERVTVTSKAEEAEQIIIGFHMQGCFISWNKVVPQFG